MIIDLHYGSMRVVEIEQFDSITADDSSANIGGLRGLWIPNVYGDTLFMVEMVWLVSVTRTYSKFRRLS